MSVSSGPFLPQLEQAGRQQGQRAGLAFDVVDQSVRELRLDRQPDPAGRQLDGTAQLGGLHGADEHVVGTEQLCERRIGGETSVKVRSERDGDERAAVGIGRRSRDRVRERGPLLLRRAGGEELLELIDGEQDSLVRLERVQRLGNGIVRAGGEHTPELVERPLAGTDQHAPPALAARQHATGERRQQPGAQHRRLAAPRRADDAEKRGPTRRATSSAISRSRPKK